MTFRKNWVSFILACLTLAVALVVQPPEAYGQTEPAVGLETPGSPAKAIVPKLIKFSGTLVYEQAQPMKSPVGVTFALYAQPSSLTPTPALSRYSLERVPRFPCIWVFSST